MRPLNKKIAFDKNFEILILQKVKVRIRKRKSLIWNCNSSSSSHLIPHLFHHRSIKDLTVRRNEHQEDRKTSWKELEHVQEEIRLCQGNIEKYKQQLNSSLPRQISLGLATVERIVEELGMTRDVHSRSEAGAYFGPVIDNFSLKNDGFRTAVEVAAGNGLFHVIVDSDKTAAVLMKELERRRCGRLTFLPLNQLRVQEITYPTSNDVRPLLEIAITFDPSIRTAIQQVRSEFPPSSLTPLTPS
jgi:structural maintenance of chromosome 3 (chondroitin sulfate proteoglycan 6)